MRLKEELYKHNVAILKDYGGLRYKISVHSALRTKGVEKDKKDIKFSAKGTVHDKKLLSNLSRAKAKVFEYALCNEWDWFVTLTLGSKYDRENLKQYKKELGMWLNNYNKNHGTNIKYLLIPELHPKDHKTWHMHGLLSGIPETHTRPFDVVREHLPRKLDGFYEWERYHKKFGFCSLGKIQDKEKVASYIVKYISKSILDCASIGMNKKCYLNSQHLKVAKELKRGYLCRPIVPDFENDYVALKWFRDEEYNLEALKDKISSKPTIRSWGFDWEQ